MSVLLDLLSWIALATGGAFLLISAIGLMRLPDFYTRTHAASITDTLGAGLVLFGLMLQAGWTLVLVKLVLIFAFIIVTTPTAAHALGKAAITDGLEPKGAGTLEPNPPKPEETPSSTS